MGRDYKYDAFISYRHVSPDKEIAEKLQKKLENYNPPKIFRNMKKHGRWHIFRDETELPTSSDLSSDIKNALNESEFLIVICSKTTKASRWCLEEIEYFKNLHNGNNANIITVVADGAPEEVFPPLLCNELIPVTDEQGNTTYQNHIIEPLAANVAGKTLKDSLKKINTEFLRVAAPMLGCGYDNLYNREHKKKIKKIFAFGGIVIALLLLFGMYNSAMLWKINNQKVALAAANEDLQNKTDELNQSNLNLQNSNKELAEKTKEAENNLYEANKQKRAAEDNLAEAEKQRKIAEQNLEEANRQKKIAEENLAESDRQKKIAEDNLDEANRQKNLASINAREANVQKVIAEESMITAQKNEAAANEANRNLKIKTSETLANKARMYLDDDNIEPAVRTALDALELCGDISVNTEAQNVLTEATGAYSTSAKMFCSKINLSGYVEFIEFSDDGTRILAKDSGGTVYVIDYEKCEVIKSYTVFETFGKTTDSLYDITVDGNNGYALVSDQLISVNLNDGSLNWHYKSADYAWFDEIVTNPNSEYIILGGGSNLIMLRKSDGAVCYSNKTETDYRVRDYMYMDSEGVLYIADNNNRLRVINPSSDFDSEYELDIEEEYKILDMGENEKCIFLNITFEFPYNNARLLCFNKSDMSVKWKTDYDGENFSDYNFNKIFEFTHNLPDDSGEFYEITGIMAVSGKNVAAFNRDGGEVYFEITDEDNILFCRPEEKRLIIGTSASISPNTYLGKEENKDMFMCYNSYSLDKNRKYIACTADDRYALASELSPEISIYRKYTPDSLILLDNVSIPTTWFYEMTDNGNGVIAAYYFDYDDNGKKHSYVLAFDVNHNELLMHREADIGLNTLNFVGEDKLIISDSDGNAMVLNLDGSIYTQMNLKDMIRKCAGLSDEDYISLYQPYIKTADNSILYMVDFGIFEIELSDKSANMRKVLYNANLSNRNYCMNGNFITWLDYNADNDKIVYLGNGDENISYILENGEPAEFKHGTISSLICSGNGNTAAFINKEGYIGIYKYGDDKISKILLPNGEVSPLKIIFSPDGEYIIAMCSNGEFVKYSAETLQQTDKYKSDMSVSSFTELNFIDETAFYVYNSSKVLIIDSSEMNVKAKMEGFIYFAENDKKFIVRTYINGKSELGYFNYLSREELIDFANDFLDKTEVR